MSTAEIDAYVATGEPLEVAGAFTIDGLAAPSWTASTGTRTTSSASRCRLLRRMLGDLDVTWTDLWATGSLDRQAETPGDEDPLDL